VKTKKDLDPWCSTLMLAIKSAQSEEAMIALARKDAPD
jgi:hypothetical protein